MKFVLKSPEGGYATGGLRYDGHRMVPLSTPTLGEAQVYTLAVRQDGEPEVEPDPPRGEWACVPVALVEAPAVPSPVRRPKVVCLCGSTRFREAFERANREETLAGNIVLSVGMFGHGEGLDMAGPVKAALDALHLQKIDMADEVLVLNATRPYCLRCEKFADLCAGCCAHRNPTCCLPLLGGTPREDRPYVGESTRREIAYAEGKGKPVRYLNPPA